jgi:hypothetical protein
MARFHGISWYSKIRVPGSIFAIPFRGVAIASAFIASMGYSGCLVSKTPVPDDADLHLPSPPVVLEDQTHPLPGRIVILDSSDSPTSTFSAAVATAGGGGDLIARWWVDRARPCSLSALNCGEQFREEPIGPATSGQTRLLTPQMFRFSLTHKCYSVELYVSSRFQIGTTQAHLPLLSGDLAHVRWYVVRLDDPSDMYVTQLAAFLANCPN